MMYATLLLTSIVVLVRGFEESPYFNVYPELPQGVLKNNTFPLYFGLMVSLSENDQSTGALSGIRSALDDINSKADLLPGYSLHYTLTTSECNKSVALDRLFVQLFESPQRKVALMEFGCSDVTEATAEISQHFNIVHITNNNELSDRVRFPYYFQLLPSEVNLARVFYSIIKEYGWRRVALVIQNEHRFKTTVQELMDLTANSMVEYREVYFDNKENFLGEETIFDLHFRVYIFMMDSSSAKHFLCKAHTLGLRYPKYVFLTYGSYEYQWWTKQDNDDQCSGDDLARVLRFSLAVLHYHEIPRKNELHNLYYDATKALALAVHDAIRDGHFDDIRWATFGSGDSSGLECDTSSNYRSAGYATTAVNSYLKATNFTGMSGPMIFDSSGIRNITKLAVLQYRTTYINGTPIIADKQSINASSIKLGLINVAFIQEISENLKFVEGNNYSVWPGNIPYDGTPREEIVTIILPVTVIFSILNICGIVGGVICFLFNITFRNKKVIRLNSPNLNYLMISGAITLFLSIFFFVIPTINSVVMITTCIIRVWFVAIGHSLAFGTVIAKLWRIYLIFKHPRIAQRKTGIKDWHLMVIVFVLVLVDVAILTVYTALEGFVARFTLGKEANREKLTAFVGEQEIETFYFVTTCSAKSGIRLGAITLIHFYKLILHICALYFAVQTRKIKIKALNDARYIILFIYTASIILGVAVVAAIILQSYINAYAVVYSSGIWLGCFAVLGFLFIPKMVLLYKDPDGDDVFPVQTEPQITLELTQHGGTDFVDIDAFKHKIKQLEKELMKYNKEMKPAAEDALQGQE